MNDVTHPPCTSCHAHDELNHEVDNIKAEVNKLTTQNTVEHSKLLQDIKWMKLIGYMMIIGTLSILGTTWKLNYNTDSVETGLKLIAKDVSLLVKQTDQNIKIIKDDIKDCQMHKDDYKDYKYNNYSNYKPYKQ